MATRSAIAVETGIPMFGPGAIHAFSFSHRFRYGYFKSVEFTNYY